MFVLDTNVVSELMRPTPDPVIESWIARRATSSLFLTVVSEAELRFGLASTLERVLETGFANRILPFDGSAARAFAEIAAARRRVGRPIPKADCQIAAIARYRDMAVTTRNVRDFEDAGIEICDPWKGA